MHALTTVCVDGGCFCLHSEVRSVAQHRVECERRAFNVVVKLVESSSAADEELEEVVRMCSTAC